jgi:large subunit ribosomal protein L17
MRHKKNTVKLDREKAPRELMLRNLASSILMYEKVKTTEAKAKAVRPLVERMISVSKSNDLAARRRLISVLPQKMAVKKCMDVLGKRYENRKGGYTRIIKIGNRQGDGGKMVSIELVS